VTSYQIDRGSAPPAGLRHLAGPSLDTNLAVAQLLPEAVATEPAPQAKRPLVETAMRDDRVFAELFESRAEVRRSPAPAEEWKTQPADVNHIGFRRSFLGVGMHRQIFEKGHVAKPERCSPKGSARVSRAALAVPARASG